MSTLVAAITNSAVGASKWHLGLFNGTGAGQPIEVLSVELVNHLTANNTGSATTFILTRTTAAGTGTSIPVRKHDTRTPAVPSSVSILGTFTVSPTAPADNELAAITVYTEETTGQTGLRDLFRADPCCGIEPITLHPGQGIGIQQTALASAGAVDIFIRFRIKRRR